MQTENKSPSSITPRKTTLLDSFLDHNTPKTITHSQTSYLQYSSSHPAIKLQSSRRYVAGAAARLHHTISPPVTVKGITEHIFYSTPRAHRSQPRPPRSRCPRPPQPPLSPPAPPPASRSPAPRTTRGCSRAPVPRQRLCAASTRGTRPTRRGRRRGTSRRSTRTRGAAR